MPGRMPSSIKSTSSLPWYFALGTSVKCLLCLGGKGVGFGKFVANIIRYNFFTAVTETITSFWKLSHSKC